MDPIPSDNGDEEQYFLDLYIPSYTPPTLSALIHESGPREPTLADLTSLLLRVVAHFDVPSPDTPLSDVCADIKVIQSLHPRLPIQTLIFEHATPFSVLTTLQLHQLVHFICHGTLKTLRRRLRAAPQQRTVHPPRNSTQLPLPSPLRRIRIPSRMPHRRADGRERRRRGTAPSGGGAVLCVQKRSGYRVGVGDGECGWSGFGEVVL